MKKSNILLLTVNLFFAINFIYSCDKCNNSDKPKGNDEELYKGLSPSEKEKVITLCIATQNRLLDSGYLKDPLLRKTLFACDRATIEEIFFGSENSGRLLSVEQINMLNNFMMKKPKSGTIMGPSGRSIVKLFLKEKNITNEQIDELNKINYPAPDIFISNEDFDKIEIKYYIAFEALNYVVSGRSDQERYTIMSMIISKLAAGYNYTFNSIKDALSKKNLIEAENQLVTYP